MSMPLPLGYTTSISIKCGTFYFIFSIMKLLGNPKIETFKKLNKIFFK
jgi:hypothetical protein